MGFRGNTALWERPDPSPTTFAAAQDLWNGDAYLPISGWLWEVESWTG